LRITGGDNFPSARKLGLAVLSPCQSLAGAAMTVVVVDAMLKILPRYTVQGCDK
jgi:hypothetical protein